MPKKRPPSIFRYLMAFLLGGLMAIHPNVQGIVDTKYETMKISCQL